MASNPTQNDIDLETFLKAAGQSFTDAQKSLVPNADVPVNMMLSTAELELRVSVRADATGRMMIRPISSDEITRGGIDPGMLSTVRINFVTALGDVMAQPTTNSQAVSGNSVPSVVGMQMGAALDVLRSGGWAVEAHAASREEVASATRESRGAVLRQMPELAQKADKTSSIVHVWVNLGGLPLRSIDGIGQKYEESLSKVGVGSVGELSLESPTLIASTLRINEQRAQALIDMAGIVSRLAVSKLGDEVAELLTRGARITSIEQLAAADPANLLKACQEAVSARRVRTQREFNFNIDDVKDWIRTARSFSET